MLAAIEERAAQLFLSESNCRTKDTMYWLDNKVIYLLVANFLTTAVAEFWAHSHWHIQVPFWAYCPPSFCPSFWVPAHRSNQRKSGPLAKHLGTWAALKSWNLDKLNPPHTSFSHLLPTKVKKSTSSPSLPQNPPFPSAGIPAQRQHLLGGWSSFTIDACSA